MKNPIAPALAATALLLAPIAHAESGPTHEAVETTTLETPLPNDAGGSLTVRLCPTCAPTLVRLTSASKFRIGKTVVAYAAFSEFVRKSGNRMLTVIYNERDRTVTRLVVDGTHRPAHGERNE